MWMDSPKGAVTRPPSPRPAPPLNPPQPSDASRYFLLLTFWCDEWHYAAATTSNTASASRLTAVSSQVTTNTEARVGRFSVSRAQEQSPDCSHTPPPAAQAANGPRDLGRTLIPDPAHKASLPSLNNNSFNNSYISSDNDSELEDEGFKREIALLREKQVASRSFSLYVTVLSPLWLLSVAGHCGPKIVGCALLLPSSLEVKNSLSSIASSFFFS